MKRITAMILVLVTMAMGLVVTAQPAEARGRDRTLEVTYCWGATEVSPWCDTALVVREAGGTLTVSDGYQTETGTWTYHQSSKTLTLYFDNYPGLVYEGQKRGGCFTGTMVSPITTGVWEGCFID